MKILDIPQSGKRGLTVSQNGRYGQISRAYVMPANPQTAAQMQVRATFGTVASAWDGLTEAQRQAWIAAAATRQTKTRCGTSGPMTGLQFFVQINANLLAMGQEQVRAPPAPPVFQPNAPQNLVITNPAGVVAMKLTCPTAPGENPLILASVPQKAGERGQTVNWCGLPREGRFWERKMGPAKAHYLWWFAASEGPHI